MANTTNAIAQYAPGVWVCTPRGLKGKLVEEDVVAKAWKIEWADRRADGTRRETMESVCKRWKIIAAPEDNDSASDTEGLPESSPKIRDEDELGIAEQASTHVQAEREVPIRSLPAESNVATAGAPSWTDEDELGIAEQASTHVWADRDSPAWCNGCSDVGLGRKTPDGDFFCDDCWIVFYFGKEIDGPAWCNGDDCWQSYLDPPSPTSLTPTSAPADDMQPLADASVRTGQRCIAPAHPTTQVIAAGCVNQPNASLREVCAAAAESRLHHTSTNSTSSELHVTSSSKPTPSSSSPSSLIKSPQRVPSSLLTSPQRVPEQRAVDRYDYYAYTK